MVFLGFFLEFASKISSLAVFAAEESPDVRQVEIQGEELGNQAPFSAKEVSLALVLWYDWFYMIFMWFYINKNTLKRPEESLSLERKL